MQGIGTLGWYHGGIYFVFDHFCVDFGDYEMSKFGVSNGMAVLFEAWTRHRQLLKNNVPNQKRSGGRLHGSLLPCSSSPMSSLSILLSCPLFTTFSERAIINGAKDKLYCMKLDHDTELVVFCHKE